MRIRESEEMYLETILLLKKKKPDVRSVDIVNKKFTPTTKGTAKRVDALDLEERALKA